MPHVAIEAANKNDVDLLKKCLSGDFDVVDITDLNEGLLRAANNGNATCVSLLLDHGVDTDTPDPDYDTPLMLATCNNQLEVVKILLKAGADVHRVSRYGRTVLHMAGFNGNSYLAKTMLMAGTNPCVKDRYGQTAMMLAATKGHYEIVKLLLDAGSEVDSTCFDADTALHCAAKKGHASVVRLLIQAGADKNAQNAWGATPLMLASEWNHSRVLQTLLAERVNCNIQGGSEKQTALHIAAKKDFQRCVELLLSHDAHPDLRNSCGFSPAMDAISKRHTSIVSLLIKFGADIDTPQSVAIELCAESLLDLARVLVAASCHQSFAQNVLRLTKVYKVNMDNFPPDETMCAWLENYTRFPESLQQICRRELRKILRGRMHSSYSLPLPFNVKIFLNMYDV